MSRAGSPGKRIAVMQPTYLPWLGLLDLLDQVDELVWLDDAAFSRQSWQQRNRVLTAAGPIWLTVPVRTHGRLGEPLCEVEIAEPRFWVKHLRTIEQSYARCPEAELQLVGLREIYAQRHERLAALDLAILGWLGAAFGIATPTVRASALDCTGVRGERVAKLCAARGATSYLTPPGAVDYLREDASHFAERGIEILVHEYVHPQYEQSGGPFVSHLSAVDALLRLGSGAGERLRSGRRKAREFWEVAA